jgi:hypothetical protein
MKPKIPISIRETSTNPPANKPDAFPCPIYARCRTNPSRNREIKINSTRNKVNIFIYPIFLKNKNSKRIKPIVVIELAK